MFISPEYLCSITPHSRTAPALIFQILQENGRVICSELANRLGVSEHTIRRDLHELSKDGVCKKSMVARSLHSLNPEEYRRAQEALM